MKKQRLIDLQEKAKTNAELADCIEILSEFFISQSQHNKEIKNEFIAINNKIDQLNRKVEELIKNTSSEPLAQLFLENLMEEEN
jgi:methyl coenzyme M reductase subunit C-like uncharacterized protein (methanogenesis marker protein 7)